MEPPAAPRRGSIFRRIATFLAMLLVGVALLASQLEKRDRQQMVDFLYRKAARFQDKKLERFEPGPFVLSEPGIEEPYFHGLVYREAMFASLRFRHGFRVTSTDTAAREQRAEFRLDRDGRRWRFGLMLDCLVAGGNQLRLQDENGEFHRLGEIPPFGADVPLPAMARRGLADADRVAGLTGVPLRPAGTRGGTELAAWEAGGILNFSKALSPLVEPEKATGRELARAARALAWQAFLDHRLAPAIAPQRAAEALALASVADAVAGTVLPDSDAARWLAPAAAAGDLIRLSGPPPPNCAELVPLARAARDPSPVPDAGRDWKVADAVAAHERALVQDDRRAFHRLGTSMPDNMLQAVAQSYFATSREPWASGPYGSTGVWVPLNSLLLAPAAIRSLFPAPTAKALTEYNSQRSDDPKAVERIAWVELAVTLARGATETPDWAARVVLEETAERLIAGIGLLRAQFVVYRNDEARRALDRTLAVQAAWPHPQVQWLLTARSAEPEIPAAVREAARKHVVAGAFRMPGMLAQEGGRELPERLGPGYYQTSFQLLHRWADWPAVVLQVAAWLAGDGRGGLALALREHVRRRHGDAVVALWTHSAGTPSAWGARRRALQTPAACADLPAVVTRRAEAWRLAGNASAADADLARALKVRPGSYDLLLERARGSFEPGGPGDAVAAECWNAAPESERRGFARKVAVKLAEMGKLDEAASWTARGQGADAGGVAMDARVLLRARKLAEAQALLDAGVKAHGATTAGGVSTFAVERTALAVAQGAAGAAGVAKLDAASVWETDYALELALAAGATLPATPAGRAWAVRAELSRLRAALPDRATLEDVSKFVEMATALLAGDPHAARALDVVPELAGPLALRALTAAPEGGAPGHDDTVAHAAKGADCPDPVHRMSALCGLPVHPPTAWRLLRSAADQARDPAVLARFARGLTDHVTSGHGAVFRALAEPAVLDAALAPAGLGHDAHWPAVQVLEYLFASGRDEDAEKILAAFVTMDDVHTKTDGRIPQMLALIAGSVPAAKQWLARHNTPTARTAGWKLDDLRFRVGTEHHLRLRFRP